MAVVVAVAEGAVSFVVVEGVVDNVAVFVVVVAIVVVDTVVAVSVHLGAKGTEDEMNLACCKLEIHFVD